MLNRISKLALVATSLAPICATLWFVEFSKNWDSKLTILNNLKVHWSVGIEYFMAAFLMISLCLILIRLSSRHLEKLPVKIKMVKTVDKEIVGFLLVYLLPLINQNNSTISASVLVFIAVLFFFIIYNSHAYHFNPLLGFFGYHFLKSLLKVI